MIYTFKMEKPDRQMWLIFLRSALYRAELMYQLLSNNLSLLFLSFQ